jgi:hypothetical protein
MGRVFIEHLNCPSYACRCCGTQLSAFDALESKVRVAVCVRRAPMPRCACSRVACHCLSTQMAAFTTHKRSSSHAGARQHPQLPRPSPGALLPLLLLASSVASPTPPATTAAALCLCRWLHTQHPLSPHPAAIPLQERPRLALQVVCQCGAGAQRGAAHDHRCVCVCACIARQ